MPEAHAAATGARNRKAPLSGAPSAPERTRTSTDPTVHKALNLARLPIPPQALEAASITPARQWHGHLDGAGQGGGPPRAPVPMPTDRGGNCAI